MHLSVNSYVLIREHCYSLRDNLARLTTSKAFPSSITPTSLCLAAGIRADVRALQSVRDGAPRGKSCSRASLVRPAMAAPNRLCETPSHGPHRQALRQASPRSMIGALGQCFPSLARRASRAIELGRNSQMRRRQPDPLRPHVMHVRKDRRNRAHLARRLGFPNGKIKIHDENLVQTIVDGKNADCRLGKLRIHLVSTRGHSLILLCQECGWFSTDRLKPLLRRRWC